MNSGMELRGLREEAANVYCREELQELEKMAREARKDRGERSQVCVANRTL